MRALTRRAAGASSIERWWWWWLQAPHHQRRSFVRSFANVSRTPHLLLFLIRNQLPEGGQQQQQMFLLSPWSVAAAAATAAAVRFFSPFFQIKSEKRISGAERRGGRVTGGSSDTHVESIFFFFLERTREDGRWQPVRHLLLFPPFCAAGREGKKEETNE